MSATPGSASPRRASRRRWAGLLAVALLAWAPAPAPARAQAGWVSHDDPAGFSVRHPRGFTVEATAARGVVVRSPDRAAFTLVQPVFARARAQAVLGNLAFPGREVFTEPRVAGVSQTRQRPDEATATLRYASPQGDGRAALLCSMLGETGMVFAIAAPASRFDRERAVLVDILKSFAFGQARAGGAGAAAPPGLRYVRWQDPIEGAFSIEVPQGWRVEGGTRRRSPVEPRHFVRATSPDGLLVGFGDPSIPTFAVPNQTLQLSGFREGSWYSPTGVARFMVLGYRTGVQFAAGYVQQTLSQGLTGVQVVDQRDRQDIARTANEAYARQDHLGFQTRVSSGEVAWSATQGGRPVAGYCLATTEITSGMGLAQWSVSGPAYYLAPPDRAPVAAAALARIFQTVQVNPQWFQAQQGTTAAVADITARTSREISGIISQSYWNRQRALDRTSQNFSDSIRGVQRVQHPETGQVYEAVAGSNYYYLPRGGDRPVGSNSADVPQYIDVTPLLRVP